MNTNIVKIEQPKKEKILLATDIYKGRIMSIYRKEWKAKNGSTFAKYHYEVAIGEFVLKGSTYTTYLDADMKARGIPTIQKLIFHEVRAQVITSELQTEDNGMVKFNKVKRIWI